MTGIKQMQESAGRRGIAEVEEPALGGRPQSSDTRRTPWNPRAASGGGDCRQERKQAGDLALSASPGAFEKLEGDQCGRSQVSKAGTGGKGSQR